MKKSRFPAILRPRIFLQLMVFYWVLLAAGLVPNPFSAGQGSSFALYVALAAVFSMLDAWLFRRPDTGHDGDGGLSDRAGRSDSELR